MRLPAKPGHQQRTEDARELHEQLWAAFQAGAEVGAPALRITIPSTRATIEADVHTLESSLHRFWTSRHFTLRCHQRKDKKGFEIWLEARNGS